MLCSWHKISIRFLMLLIIIFCCTSIFCSVQVFSNFWEYSSLFFTVDPEFCRAREPHQIFHWWRLVFIRKFQFDWNLRIWASTEHWEELGHLAFVSFLFLTLVKTFTLAHVPVRNWITSVVCSTIECLLLVCLKLIEIYCTNSYYSWFLASAFLHLQTLFWMLLWSCVTSTTASSCIHTWKLCVYHPVNRPKPFKFVKL